MLTNCLRYFPMTVAPAARIVAAAARRFVDAWGAGADAWEDVPAPVLPDDSPQDAHLPDGCLAVVGAVRHADRPPSSRVAPAAALGQNHLAVWHQGGPKDNRYHDYRAPSESRARSIRPTRHRYDPGQEWKATRECGDEYQLVVDHSWPYYEPLSELRSILTKNQGRRISDPAL